MIPPNSWSSVVRTTVKGAMITLGSTTIALGGAIYVERTAHRTLYHFFPHWYRDVEHAAGLDPDELKAARTEYLNRRDPYNTEASRDSYFIDRSNDNRVSDEIESSCMTSHIIDSL